MYTCGTQTFMQAKHPYKFKREKKVKKKRKEKKKNNTSAQETAQCLRVVAVLAEDTVTAPNTYTVLPHNHL